MRLVGWDTPSKIIVHSEEYSRLAEHTQLNCFLKQTFLAFVKSHLLVSVFGNGFDCDLSLPHSMLLIMAFIINVQTSRPLLPRLLPHLLLLLQTNHSVWLNLRLLCSQTDLQKCPHFLHTPLYLGAKKVQIFQEMDNSHSSKHCFRNPMRFVLSERFNKWPSFL